MKTDTLISSSSLSVFTPDGRQVVDNLDLHLAHEQVAIIGRNGAGKSTLLNALAAQDPKANIQRTNSYFCVHQAMDENRFNCENLDIQALFSEFEHKHFYKECSKIGLKSVSNKTVFSQGEVRKLNLVYAKLKCPDLLLLDEPTIDLDEVGKTWLIQWLANWQGGLMVVTHETQLQAIFQHFFILTESGCRLFSGSNTELQHILEQEQQSQQSKYLNNLNHLLEQVKRSDKISKRRQQKKNQGRLRELGRMTPKVRLNAKRSYAQESQGRVANIEKDRIDNLTTMVKIARNQLKVSLPLKLFMPALPPTSGRALIALREVSLFPLFDNISVSIEHNRLAITGANGSGKTSLLEVMLGLRKVQSGAVETHTKSIGYIAQGARNWDLEISLIEYLYRHSGENSQADVLQLIVAHKFPLGLAERPMKSLSPGEKLRAALICLFVCGKNGLDPMECLVLDEPTVSLDSLAFSSLKESLNLWQGGLVVVSHDNEFLDDIKIEDHLCVAKES